MGIPYFFTCFCLFLGWLALKRHIATRKDQERASNFWEKEDEANTTRRQDVSGLPYIHIPVDALPFGCCSNSEINEYEQLLLSLTDKKILNLTGLTNTDLKLKYGAANLPFLSECDENFTVLCRVLYQWGDALYKEGLQNEARQVLEFAVCSGSDVSGNYSLLAEIYKENGDTSQIQDLITRAQQLNSLSKDIIILKLSEFVHN